MAAPGRAGVTAGASSSSSQRTPFLPRVLELSRPVVVVHRKPATAPAAAAATALSTPAEPQTQQEPATARIVRMLPCDRGGAHVRATMDVYMSAFAGGAFTYWWPADLGAMRVWQEQRALNRCRDERSVQYMAVLDSPGSGGGGGGHKADGHGNGNVEVEDVVAYSKWTLPSPATEAGKRQFEGLRRALVDLDQAGEIGSGTATANSSLAEASTISAAAAGEQSVDGGGKAHKDIRGDHPADIPDGSNAAFYNEFFDGIERISKKWRCDEMIELSLMATRPSYHGHGIAAAMIRHVLDVVDQHGVRAVLLGLELATPLYRRLGFETVETFSFELAKREAGEDGVMHVMIREPRDGAGDGETS